MESRFGLKVYASLRLVLYEELIFDGIQVSTKGIWSSSFAFGFKLYGFSSSGFRFKGFPSGGFRVWDLSLVSLGRFRFTGFGLGWCWLHGLGRVRDQERRR